MRRALACVAFLSIVSAARAERVLRIATVAPDGTAYARTIRAFGTDVERGTDRELRLKFYFGGIAGDDRSAAERISKGQLDGVIASNICETLSPSMRVLHLPGLYRNRAEWNHVMNSLRSVFDEEMLRAGFVNLGEAGLGPTIILSRKPVRSLAELRALKLWSWDSDEVKRLVLPQLGVRAVPLPLSEADHAYLDRRIDGFLAVPTAALAFQWSAHGGYLEDLRIDHLAVCLIVAQASFDRLPIEQQKILRGAGAKGLLNFENVSSSQDELLLGGLFAHQGITPVPVSDAFRTDFIDASRLARKQLGERLVPPALLERVQQLLAGYRGGHAPTPPASGPR